MQAARCWFAACAGSPCNWGMPVRRYADEDTRPPGGSGHSPRAGRRRPRGALALNAWMARAFRQFERSVAIVSSDMLITEPRPDLPQEIGSAVSARLADLRALLPTTLDGRADALGAAATPSPTRRCMLPVFDRPHRISGNYAAEWWSSSSSRRGRHRSQLERVHRIAR